MKCLIIKYIFIPVHIHKFQMYFLSLNLCFFLLEWLIYEQVCLAALDCHRLDIAQVRLILKLENSFGMCILKVSDLYTINA